MILARETLTPIKIYVSSQSNFIVYMGISYYDALFRFTFKKKSTLYKNN